jgi:hypothetical protein
MFLILRRNSTRYYHKCTPVFTLSTRYSCQILKKFDFSRLIFGKNTQISDLIKIRPVGAEFFYAGKRTGGRKYERTDMIKQIVSF